MERRLLLAGLGLLAAPSIVRASSLMPIRAPLPDWITAHANNPLLGELVVRKPGVKHLSYFEGVIQHGEFFWRTPDGRLIDLCTFERTDILLTPSMCSITNGGGHWGSSRRPGITVHL